ncbi:hypothetical protein OAN94_07745 [Verrucomicrobiales bacterium]|nr:hypothetical protein [Verrucomicrobiales bacterium]MDC0504158.1 hypothetical protein [Verrucomicrobiales bacterium]
MMSRDQFISHTNKSFELVLSKIVLLPSIIGEVVEFETFERRFSDEAHMLGDPASFELGVSIVETADKVVSLT